MFKRGFLSRGLYRKKQTENTRSEKGMKRMKGTSRKFVTIICMMIAIIMCPLQSTSAHQMVLKESDMFPISDHTEKKKVAYLTFDDGPSRNTIRILDILDQYEIKATFFVMADSSPEAMQRYKEMINRGHTIALHTYTHDYNKIYTSTDVFFENIAKLEKFLKDNFSIETNILRFPGGSKNVSSRQYGGPQIMANIVEKCEELGYRYFDWNVDSKDGISPHVSVSEIVNNVLKGAEGKKEAIILMHDINAMNNTVTALPTIIKGLQKQEFEFDVISDKTEDIRFK